MFLFQQARLSHYGGGKSSSIEVETLLVSPPFWVQSLVMNSPPQSQTTILFFSLLFFDSVLFTRFIAHFCLFFLFCFCFSAWVYCMDGFLLCSLLKMFCAWWKVAKIAPNAAPPPLFFVSMSTCNVYVTYCVCDVTQFPEQYLLDLWLTVFQRDRAGVFITETAACFFILKADWGGVWIHFA